MGNVVEYAEGPLQVHVVWEDWQLAFDEYEQIGTDVLNAKVSLRHNSEELADIEADIAIRVRARPDISSEAQYTRALKDAVAEDQAAKKARANVAQARHALDTAEQSLREGEWKLKGLTARMHELGGLMEFYAARTKRA